MAPPHRCVALMAAVAAAALLLTLDTPAANARLRGVWGARVRDRLEEVTDFVEIVRFTMTEAERWNTLKVLQAFAAAMPSLGWSGGDFCSWSGVTCSYGSVGIMITGSWVTGTLPEMPDDVDYSMVKLDEINVFGEDSGITGTLPSSWGKLRKMRAINLVYTDISGTLPAAWSSMEAMEQIIVWNSSITGTLPELWSTMHNLRFFHLNGCNLDGTLPESWARMRSLEDLDLRNNHFCGCVPNSWVKSPKLLKSVESKYRMGSCRSDEACFVTTAPEPMMSSSSTTRKDDLISPSRTRTTTTRLPSSLFGHPCHVSNCVSCAAAQPRRCGKCVDGYLLSMRWQCVTSFAEDSTILPVGPVAVPALCVVAVVLSAIIA